MPRRTGTRVPVNQKNRVAVPRIPNAQSHPSDIDPLIRETVKHLPQIPV